jgi:hypothetical protein
VKGHVAGVLADATDLNWADGAFLQAWMLLAGRAFMFWSVV